MPSLLIEKSMVISRIAHKGQMRLQGEPYFNHPERIAKRAEFFGFPEQAVAAAYLHDVIEDCDIKWTQLVILLLDAPLTIPTCDLVLQVTNVAKPEDGNRATRMAINRAHLAKSSYWGASLKCLDIEDNLTSPFDDPVWAKKYFAEKELEIAILRHADPRAWTVAHDACCRGPTIVPKTGP